VRHVVVAIFPGVQALDVSGPLDVFSEANAFVAADSGYVASVASAGAEPVRASNGQRLLADVAFEDAAARFDIALVAGGPALPTQAVPASLVAWLRAVAAHAPRHGSICTGTFALGAAGLLAGRRVTTHWQWSALLARRFPDARVEADRIHCRDGPLITSAGVTAGIDLALALVAEDHGAAVARAVAKRLVVFAHRQGGQSQFSPYLAAVRETDDPMARVQAHVMANLRGDLSVAALAAAAGMGLRSFARDFGAWAQATPREFVERARIDAARHALESTEAPLKTVAFDCGFASADRMRLAFVRSLDVSPAAYRARFRGRPDSSAD
jgi:transcriptional regulator GlxA family with amidase domain